MEGFSLSTTVTIWLQEEVSPELSVTVQVTVVLPIGNAYVVGSILFPPTLESIEAIPQLSLVVGVPKVTVVEQSPVPFALVLAIIFAGQLIDGGMLSVIVTVLDPVIMFPAASVTL